MLIISFVVVGFSFVQLSYSLIGTADQRTGIDLDDYLYNPQIGEGLVSDFNDMAYRANGSTYQSGPPNVNMHEQSWEQSTSLQPLQVNVSSSEMPDGSKSLTLGRRRHKTDPSTANRQITDHNNSAPASHSNNGGPLVIDEGDDFASHSCYSNSNSNNNSNNNINTNECSTPSTSCMKNRRKSKRKPENVCQVVSLNDKQMSDMDYNKTPPQIKEENNCLNEGNQNICVGDDAEKFCRRSVAAKYSSQLRSRYDKTGHELYETAYRPPPILSPNRAGRGLYCNLKTRNELDDLNEVYPSTSKLSSASDSLAIEASKENSVRFNGLVAKFEEDDGPKPKRFRVAYEKISLDEELKKPLRKKGFSYSPGSFPNFKAELQRALEETSYSPKSSVSSHSSNYERSANINFVGRVGAVDELETYDTHKKVSESGESVYMSDAVPKINRGDRYQAGVSKWVEREITEEELSEIPDRDERVFDCNVISHLDPQAVAAFELLACSQAVPVPGRNKELALHLLMSNKGNLSEAVADLMKADMLNWEQTPVVHNSIYNDSVFWTPSEIALFQEAIYKSEKDFTEVAKKVRKTVKQCVEFFYMWKKAFPDDYKKLSNLVRKRRLLTQQGYHLRSSVQKDKSQNVDESESESDLSSIVVEEREMNFGEDLRSHMPAQLSGNVMVDEQKVPVTQVSDSFDLGSLTSGENGSSTAKDYTPNMNSPLSSRLPATIHRAAIKKGAQPAPDGYFHCRLCDKYFEKVKSLNAHMKSHAMKARAEAEAQAQIGLQYNNPNGTTSGMREKMMSSNVNIGSVQNTSSQLGQNQLNAVARAANALSQSGPFSAVNALNQAALAQAQDLFVQTSLAQDQLVQSTLLQSPLSQASLAAQNALGQSALGQAAQNALGQSALGQAAQNALGQAAQSVLGQATQNALGSAAQTALGQSALSSVLGQGLQMPSAALQLFSSLHPTISHSTV